MYSKLSLTVSAAGVSVVCVARAAKSRILSKRFWVNYLHAKIGYSFTALIFVQVEGEHLSMLQRKIAESKSVVAVYDVTGEFDAVVIARFNDQERLSYLIKCLAGCPALSARQREYNWPLSKKTSE